MEKYTMVSFCKTCGSPIFVMGQPVTGSDGTVIECDQPQVFRTCRCFEHAFPKK